MISLSIEPTFDFASAAYAELFAASDATAFQHPDWLDAFYRILAPDHDAESHVIVGRDQHSDTLQFVLPLIRRVGSLEYAFLGVTDYACPVFRRSADPDDVPLAELRAAIGGGPFEIAPVREEHVPQWRQLLGTDPTPLSFMAHAMPVAPSAGAGPRYLSARRRNDLARKAKRLGRLELEVVHGSGIRDAFAEAQLFRRRRFEEDPLQRADGLEFYADVATRGGISGLTRSFRLSHEDRTVAMLFGLVDGSRFRYIILACDYPRYSEFSPGLLILERVMAHWAQEGGRVFDFTIGDEPYKNELGCNSTRMFKFAKN